MAGSTMWPRLLAAERVLAGPHLLEHIAVTDPGGAHRDPGLAHRQVQPEVAHHGGDQCIGGQLAGVHGQCEYHHDRVPVDDLTGGVDGQAPVGVTVVGQPEVRPVRRLTAACSCSRCVDPQWPHYLWVPLHERHRLDRGSGAWGQGRWA